MTHAVPARAPIDARALAKAFTAHRTPSVARAAWEIAVTAVPLLVFWGLALWSAAAGAWLGLLFTIPAGLFLVRLFLIQHDCGHGSFFASKAANDWTGRVLGVFTFTPYAYWRQTHAVHHGTSGNLDRREMGAIDTFTVAEYRAMSPLRRAMYKVYRHPFTQFGFGPAFVFLLQHRLPIDLMRAGWKPWASVMGTNLTIALGAIGLASVVGWGPVLIVQVLMVAVGASVGVWLFYVQHQFEETFWSRTEGWKLHEAALHGSSFYDLPAPLRWLTANIGVHHVHHADSRIPSYRLHDVLHEHPELKSLGRITLWGSLKCVRLALWDEARGRMVTFREARAAG